MRFCAVEHSMTCIYTLPEAFVHSQCMCIKCSDISLFKSKLQNGQCSESRDPTSLYFAERNIHNNFCLNNEEDIRLLNFLISISKCIRGGEGVQKACEAQGKRKKEETQKMLHYLLRLTDHNK